MLIGGINPFTLLDYHTKTACILFTVGCNLRCGFCHNPHLVLPEKIKKLQDSLVSEVKIFEFLKKREGLLDGVVISGGEPTMQSDLEDFIYKIKSLGFLVKLDTNGLYPEVLKKLLQKKLIDFVSIDIKTIATDYKKITSVCIDPRTLELSRDLLLSSNIQYEFRTTVLQSFHNEEIIYKICKFCIDSPFIDSNKLSLYTIQNFRSNVVLHPEFKKYQGFPKEKLEKFKNIAKEFFDKVIIYE